MKITKYEITGPSWDGSDLAMMVAGDSPENAIAQCSRADEMKWTGRTEEVPYLHYSLISAIAAALPGEWEAVPISREYADCNFHLVRADGLSIFAASPSYSRKGKWQFSASLPRVPCSIGSASIGCGEEKSPEKMAADIAKRLLPDCERLHEAAVAAVAKDQEAKDAQSATAVAVGEACGGTVRDHRGDVQFCGYGAGGLNYLVANGGRVYLSFDSMDCAAALRVIAAIKSA